MCTHTHAAGPGEEVSYMLETYIESHSSLLAAQIGEEQQDEGYQPGARDEDDHVGRGGEERGPGLRD